MRYGYEPDELLTIQQVADILQMDRKWVLRRFEHLPGVVDASFGGTSKRRYRLLRIPRPVLTRFLAEHSLNRAA
jgi:hypothetical protein